MILNQFAKRLATLRKKAQLTQSELAEKSGYSIEFISLMERAKNGPTLEGVERISGALNIKAYELFLFDEESL